ncbi:MAG: superoxide dismutase [Candidatus Vogelbacteria bacterium RIFOXYD2_FULL_44_9]|uniref:Superoxide dismutase n=1 Tax=Candidatus Vogelbacteria bacterium RIFOXYD2_FULL_44_9 TaxID=1802441 RepID=A0A1G2QMB6_9BACT|nr:MAG: superoxide dismutase [Candidatus Vogelbacteria bacterium RIFOXYD2_FULL_44_9]
MYKLPILKYDFSALEPYFDEETMRLHYGKHHQAYADKLNTALADFPELSAKPIEDLLKNLDSIPEGVKSAVRNFGGGFYNHNFFFDIIGPKSDNIEPMGKVKEAIEKSFGSFADFKKEFTEKTVAIFGSGWGWLVKNQTGSLQIISSPNQDCPLSAGLKPILACDVWEHAYYLKYQNRRAEFVEVFFQVIDWKRVEEIYNS